MQDLRKAAQQALKSWEDAFKKNKVDARAITALLAALEHVTDCHENGGVNLSPPLERTADAGEASNHIADATKMVATINETETVEPVAYMMVNKTHGHAPSLHFAAPENWHVTWEAVPLYMIPPKREPLTEAEIGEIAADILGSILIAPQNSQQFVRAIERAHGIGGEE